MTNSIAKQESAVPVPGSQVLGMEEVDESDIPQPRIKLNQSGSPLVKDEAAKAGEFSHSISEENYGKGIIFQPVIYHKTRIKWPEDPDVEGWECRSYDGKTGDVYGDCKKCAFKEWGKGDNGEPLPPPCNAIHNYLSIIRATATKEGVGEPIIVSFMRTSAREGQQLIQKIKVTGRYAWARKYKLTSKPVTKGKYDYFVMKVDSGEPASNEEVKYCNAIYDQWRGKEIVVDMSDESDEFDDTTDADKVKEKTKPEPEETIEDVFGVHETK